MREQDDWIYPARQSGFTPDEFQETVFPKELCSISFFTNYTLMRTGKPGCFINKGGKRK
ncbi:MAG: hypothetical protein IJS41_02130 [Clostridia bacterium]|nr:hypothetical protein [Clostridia bacterium]